MGDFNETHVRRSSSMSFALRWKRETLRLIIVAAIFSIAMTFMFMMMIHAMAPKQVTLVMNGQSIVLTTKTGKVSEMLQEQGIILGEHDRLSVDVNAELVNAQKIVLDKAKPIQVTADGETTTLYVFGRTVGDALGEAGISVSELDRVQPAVTTELNSTDDIRVVRVNKELVQLTETIPYHTEQTEDPDLLSGKRKVVQQGQEGETLITKEIVYEDGAVISDQILETIVHTQPTNQIVALGTKAPVAVLDDASANTEGVSPEGLNFPVKQVLNNVKLTAYTAGPGSTGKGVNHPQYGITASGTRATEGRTIAVDPRVIPMGWWVYIEGLGYRRAEDTGGAVKGNVIDVYFNSHDYAIRFGAKHGNKVYVIGPNKPESE